MGRQLDSDAVVTMLRKESKEWETAGDGMSSAASRSVFYCIAKGYQAAAQDVEKMANEQADGSVPADKC